MTQGHGDDIHRYPHIRVNFSSNIYTHADLSELKAYLCKHIGVIENYPEPEPYSLEAMIAQRMDIPAACVLVTSGATEAIYLMAQTFAHRFRHYAIGCLPTFSEYADACEMFGMTRRDDRSHTDDALLWLCNPNNPTGIALDSAAVKRMRHGYRLTVIDQSYEDYTFKPLMAAQDAVQDDRYVLIHSLTKTYAIPGLRIGYITASPTIIRELRHYVRPWAVNAMAIAAAKWLTAHDTKAIPDLEAYLAEANWLRQQLNLIPGIKVGATHTSFMTASIEQATACELKEWLATRHGLLVRDASNFEGLTPHHFRISTQRRDENMLLTAAIRQFVGE